MEQNPRVLSITQGEIARALHDALTPGYVIVLAETGDRGLELFNAKRPDCVFVDADLADAAAPLVLSELRRNRVYVPAIILTDSEDDAIRRAAWDAGAHDILSKGQLTSERARHSVTMGLRYASLHRSLDEIRGDLRFLSTAIARDVKGPLSRMVDFGRDANTEDVERSSAEVLSYFQETERIVRTLDRLLDYWNLDDRRPRREVVDLNAVAVEVLEKLEGEIRRSGAQIHCEALPPVIGDPDDLLILLRNLIENSLKFAKGGEPRVVVKSRRKEDRWEISVQDEGVGIDPRLRSAIFAPGPPTQSPLEAGGGLGLATCRKIVERHGGRIRVVSELGRGSLFRFTLPAAGRSAGSSPETPSWGGAPRARTATLPPP
jgi:signal transduction histidine kinase